MKVNLERKSKKDDERTEREQRGEMKRVRESGSQGSLLAFEMRDTGVGSVDNWIAFGSVV